jgi:hypothetical protein
MEAERHLSAALGGRGHTRRFVAGLFAQTHPGLRVGGRRAPGPPPAPGSAWRAH